VQHEIEFNTCPATSPAMILYFQLMGDLVRRLVAKGDWPAKRKQQQ